VLTCQAEKDAKRKKAMERQEQMKREKEEEERRLREVSLTSYLLIIFHC
jgi:hypothetical protein